MNTAELTDEQIDQLTTLASRLVADRGRLDAGEKVSDSAVQAPRVGSARDRRTGSGHWLARHLFPSADADRQRSYVQYGQLLSSLRRRYLEQLQADQEPTSAELTPHRLARYVGHREVFESLLEAPLSEGILHPVPMPVDEAPEEELTPILDHVASGASAGEDFAEFTRGTYFADGRIDMCKQVVAERYIGALVDSVKQNTHVQHFLIGNNIVGDTGAAKIAQLLRDPEAVSSLRTLYLAGNRVGPAGSALLAEALSHHPVVKSLWLKRNPIHAEGVRHLAKMLETNTTLETLDLVNTGLLDEGVQALFASLRLNTGLRTLYLDANGITPVGARAIADYFHFLKEEGRVGLTGLFIGINRLGDEGAAIIADGVRDYPHLVRLDLSSNRIQERGLIDVLGAVQTLPALRYLGLGLYKSTADLGELPNYFDSACADHLAAFIRDNHTVQVLDLVDVNLRPGGLEVMVDAVENNHTLLHLIVQQFGGSHPRIQTQRLTACLERNVHATTGLSLQAFRSEQVRYIKHTDEVRYIDSIYRNRM